MKTTASDSQQRHRWTRPFIVVLVVALIIGVAWIVEINTFISSVRNYSSAWCSDCIVPVDIIESESQSTETPKKDCVRLNHRDPHWITKQNDKECLSQDEVVLILRDLVLTIKRTFDAHNLTYFLESGTLLGSYREKGVIRHDRDADMGIDPVSLDYIRKNKVHVPDEYFLAVWESDLYPGSGRDDKLPVRLIHKETALYSDVFAFLDWKNETAGTDEVGPLPSVCFNRCSACPQVKGVGRHFKVPREWVYPLVDCPFEGHTLKCPREPAKYLEHMYGKNYMKPS